MAQFYGLTFVSKSGYTNVFTLPDTSNSPNFVLCSLNGSNVLIPANPSYSSCSSSLTNFSNYWSNLQTVFNSYGVSLPSLTSGATNFGFPLASNSNVVNLSDPIPIYSGMYISNANSAINGNILYQYTIDESSGGDTPDSGSTDMSGVVNAILMIPAVLIVLGVFTMIYRMFINRRVRG